MENDSKFEIELNLKLKAPIDSDKNYIDNFSLKAIQY